MSKDLAFRSAISLRRKLAAREVSAAELCELFLARIGRYNTRSRASIEVQEAAAKAVAE